MLCQISNRYLVHYVTHQCNGNEVLLAVECFHGKNLRYFLNQNIQLNRRFEERVYIYYFRQLEKL